jgi:hypothetical protein
MTGASSRGPLNKIETRATEEKHTKLKLRMIENEGDAALLFG